MGTELGTCFEREELGGGRFRHIAHLRPIAYLRDGGYRRIVSDWAAGDESFPHVVTDAPMLVYTAPNGDRRICPTRDPARWFSISAPYIKPSTTWTQPSLGTFSRSGNTLSATTANVNTYIWYAGHYVKAGFLLKNGWLPPNNQFAFRLGLNGLERQGTTFYADGEPVMSLRAPVVYDWDNPDDTRPIEHTLVQVAGAWYVLFTLPSLTGMTRPVVDPTLALQPDETAGVDTFLREGYPTLNYGVSAQAPDAVGTYLWKFSLVSIPAGATIQTATLYLYNHVTKTTNRSGSLYELAAANTGWVEGAQNTALAGAGEPCWNAKAADGAGGVTTAWAGSAGCRTAGTDYVDTVLGAISYTASSPHGTELPVGFDAAGLACVASHAGSTLPLIMYTGVNVVPACHFSDEATTTLRPKLVIEYTLPGGGSILEGSIFRSAIFGGTMVR